MREFEYKYCSFCRIKQIVTRLSIQVNDEPAVNHVHCSRCGKDLSE